MDRAKSIPKYLSKFITAKDPQSIFTEHEVDYLYCRINKSTRPKPRLCLWLKLINKQEIEIIKL